MPFLVMEYQPGGTLKKNGPPDGRQDAEKFLAPMVGALDYIHKQGNIHRDIKPAYVLISQSGQPMLSDFGISKILDTEETIELTGTGIGIDLSQAEDGREGLSSESERCIRGGAWDEDAANVRSAYRDDENPQIAWDYLGFRCAITALD